MQTNRGCPYTCRYCSSPDMMNLYKHENKGSYFRKKRVDLVSKELKYFVSRGAEYFYFWADTFLAMNKKEFEEFCDMYKEIHLPFWMQTRPETINDYNIKKLVEVGLDRISFGIEHGNEEFRKKILDTNNLIQTEGLHNIKEILEKKTPTIFFGIHHSNWEIGLPILDRIGMNVGGIYRHINNHLIDRFVLSLRTDSLKTSKSFYTPKGKQSARDILEAVKNNNSFLLLVDQKDSAGENVFLFNKSVKTQTGFLKIARKYNMPLVPM